MKSTNLQINKSTNRKQQYSFHKLPITRYSLPRNGFTLIELLVVIGIIGMLVAIVVPNFLSARQRASDSQKKEDAIQLKGALRLYYNDFQQYPPNVNGGAGKFDYIAGCGASGTATCPCTYSYPGYSVTLDFASGSSCESIYMKRFPAELGDSTWYIPSADKQDFCLRVLLSNNSDPDILTTQARCFSACGGNCTGANRYCVCAD